MFKGKKIVVGVTGGIAAYKTCGLVSALRKQDAEIDVVMTKNATEFVAPLTFETLSSRPVTVDTFNRRAPWEVEHIALAKKADLFVIAPATANFIGKYACGIADDMLTTTVMATRAPVLVVPAMNTGMYESAAVTGNIATLKRRGVSVMEAASGRLACGDTGKGKMPELDEILAEMERLISVRKDFVGKKVLVTAGATVERLDPVRFITNFSSGKMGVAIAERAFRRGAEVTLVLGRHGVSVPGGIKVVSVETTEDMYEAVMKEMKDCDLIVKAAAPCDYKPSVFSGNKIKSSELTVSFSKNKDIAAEVGRIKGDKKLVVFSAETENLLENARNKLLKKNADLVVANDVTQEGAGFLTDTNKVYILDRKGVVAETPVMSKSEVADVILDCAAEIL